MKSNKIVSVDIVNILSKEFLLNCVKSVILKNKITMDISVSKWLYFIHF